MSLKAWIRSARTPSQLTIYLPLVLGQLFAPTFDGWIFVGVMAFAFFDHLYIVWGNDYADRGTDGRNPHPTPFGGGSRVLLDGSLHESQLAIAIPSAAFGLVMTTGLLVVGSGALVLVPLAVFALLLLWMYSYPPVRLSFRGGGEVLQMLGVGLVLPLYGYAAQASGAAGFPWWTLGVSLPLQLGTALATTRPDEIGDRLVDKRTLSVILGGPRASLVMLTSYGVALGFFALRTGPTGALGVLALPLLFGGIALVTRSATPGRRSCSSTSSRG
ncbi:MAG: prenyltransferase [Myxococcales bacterium]|nr:prenyltransferase [Myxococcales bacterium]